MMTALKKDLETRFHDPEARHTWLEIAYTCSDEMAQEFKETVAEIYPDANICIAPLSLSIACHIGRAVLLWPAAAFKGAGVDCKRRNGLSGLS